MPCTNTNAASASIAIPLPSAARAWQTALRATNQQAHGVHDRVVQHVECVGHQRRGRRSHAERQLHREQREIDAEHDAERSRLPAVKFVSAGRQRRPPDTAVDAFAHDAATCPWIAPVLPGGVAG
jgi:hypothetical protein